MARMETSRTFQVERQKAWDYMNDFTKWPDWAGSLTAVIDPEKSAWETPGDKVLCEAKLLGRRFKTDGTLDEKRDYEYARMTWRAERLPDLTQEWSFSDDDGGTRMDVVWETEGTTNFFGKLIDRTLLPRTLERDLKRTMENLEDVFSMGV